MPAKAIRPCETTLLGLLSEGPLHPYQLEKIVRERDMRYWTDLSMSSIYKLLPALEQRGLVACAKEVQAQGRLRKVFRITPAGRKALRECLLAWLAEPEHLKWRLDIAVSNLANLTRRQILQALARHRAALDKLIAGYRALEKFLADSGCPPYRMALARRPIRVYEGERLWLDEYIAEIKRTREG